jgi:hypothetical protein
MPTLTQVKIYPSIGIARIGNSQEWYIGPELPFPAPPPVPSDGNYKDNQCRIRRQAQRFRLWGYFNDGTNRELTATDGAIQWTVHLANAKAVFQGEAGGLIDPGPRTLNGPNDSATFANGTYTYSGENVEVPLGDAETDADGRLIVRGGFGTSVSPTGSGISSFWQNSGWCDDISDGPVNATITEGGQAFTAVGAWSSARLRDLLPPRTRRSPCTIRCAKWPSPKICPGRLSPPRRHPSSATSGPFSSAASGCCAWRPIPSARAITARFRPSFLRAPARTRRAPPSWASWPIPAARTMWASPTRPTICPFCTQAARLEATRRISLRL